MDVRLDGVLCWSSNPGSDMKGLCTLHHMHSPGTRQHNFLFPCFRVFSSVSGPTSGASCILAPLLRFGFRMMFFGLCWQLTCSTASLPSWWPYAFTATITFSSRSPHFPGRPVCQTARRKTPSTKINKLTILSQSYGNCSSLDLWNCFVSKCPNKSLFYATYLLPGHSSIVSLCIKVKCLSFRQFILW